LRTKTKIFSFTIIVLFAITIFANTEYSFADGNITDTVGNITDAESVEATASPSKVNAGGTVSIIVTIDNSDKMKIVIENITMSPWYGFHNKTVVNTNSMHSVTLDVDIPAETQSGDHTIVASIMDSKGITRDVTAKITVNEFAPLELSWMLGLLAAYLIPAQIIERIIEKIKVIPEKKDGKKSIVCDKRIAKLEETKGNLKKKIEFFNKVRDHMMTSTSKVMTVEEAKEQYKEMKKIDAVIADDTQQLASNQTQKAFRIWLQSLWMAAFPGAVFAFFGIGIFQIIGYDNEIIKIIDGIINTAFIASGTKPIHDIIGILVRGKEAREGKLKDT